LIANCGKGVIEEKMNIFLSYGHKDYPEFVKRFVVDLGKRYAVWADESIRLGDAWVQEIDNAISKCDLFLFLMGPDAIRKDSYCYGEIIFAKNIKKKIIVVSLEKVNAPTIIAQEQLFSMENVFDICGDLQEDEYNDAFPRLCLRIEQCMVNSIEGGMARALPLRTFDNTQKINNLLSEQHYDPALLELIEKWLKDNKPYFVLFGGAGCGKSTAAAYIYETYKHKSTIHFCNYVNENTTDVCIMMQTVADQLSKVCVEYKERIAYTVNFERSMEGLSANDIFDELFLKPLSSLNISDPYMIILDGVDEIPQKQRKDFFRIVLKRHHELSGKLRLVLTSRKDSEVAPALYANGAEILSEYEKYNNYSIKSYIKNWFEKRNMRYDDECLEKIIIQSKGDFLYIKFILEELRLRGTSDVTNVFFPIGMKGVCQSYFDRIFSEEDDYYTETVAPFLEILTTAKMPVSVQMLENLLGIDVLDIRGIIKKLDMFIEMRDDSLMLVHKSVYDWLCSATLNDKYYISLNRGRKKLCDYVISEFGKGKIDNYVAEYGFKHLAESDKTEKIAEIIAREPRSMHSLFIRFVTQMLLSGETEFLVKLFNFFAVQKHDAYFIVAEVLKLMLQYGKKTEAETIIECFENDEQKTMLKELLDFYNLKTLNINTAHIINKGEAIIGYIKDDIILSEIMRILGDAYRENGHHEDAVRLYNAAKTKAHANITDSIYLDCECALIDMQYVNGNLKDALNALHEVKERIDFINPNIYAYKYYRLLGQIFHADNSIYESMNAFNECLRIAKLLSFPLKQIETNNSLAELQDDLNIGQEYLSVARKIDEEAKLNRLEYGKGFYIEANLLAKNKKSAEAMACVDEAIRILEEVGYGSGSARSYLIKANLLFDGQSYNEALSYATKAYNYYVRENIYPAFKLEAASLLKRIQEKC
jgi:tetratricopeptide (TPR) repeat protein